MSLEKKKKKGEDCEKKKKVRDGREQGAGFILTHFKILEKK